MRGDWRELLAAWAVVAVIMAVHGTTWSIAASDGNPYGPARAGGARGPGLGGAAGGWVVRPGG